MSKVLVGLDRSDSSSRALQYALDSADTTDLLLVHVIQWSPFALTSGEENENRHRRRQEEIDAARTEIVDEAEKSAGDKGMSCTSVIRFGHPAEVIIELATEHQVREVVVGRVGDSRFRQAVFGSLTGQLTQACPVPVTVVP